MRLTVFNGSPRGKTSNTSKLLEHFLAGFGESKGNEYEQFVLAREKDMSPCVQAFAEAETVLLAFPLYTDCMPAVVKNFIELLEPLCGRENNPALAFFVHSGFPESVHSHAVRDYLEKLSNRLGCTCLGTMIKGGTEAIRVVPENMNSKLFKTFYELGEIFGQTGEFDRGILEKLAHPVRYNKITLLSAKIWLKMAERMYWDKLLKENGAFEKRFDAPYLIGK